MKKVLSLLTLMVIAVCAVAQVDSASVINMFQVGGDIANTVHPTDWINGVPNSIVSTIVTTVVGAIIGLIHRRRSLKKLRRSGKLTD